MSEGKPTYIDGLAKSGKDAFKGWNLIKRAGLLFFFAIILSLKSCTQHIDRVGASGGGLLRYAWAFKDAVWDGAKSALASIYPIIMDFSGYWNAHYWGSLILSAVFIGALIGLSFQPLSLLLNIIDGKVGQVFGFIIRLTVTMALIVVLSIAFYHNGDVDIFTTDINAQEVVDNVTALVNNTMGNNTLGDVPIINLLGDEGGG